MPKTWYVLVHAFEEKGCTITLKNRQIIFEDSKIIVRGSEDQDGGKEYDCSQILYRQQPLPLKSAEYTQFNIELAGHKHKRLTVTIRREEFQYAVIFADSFNRFAEKYKDKMAKPAKKTTNVPRLLENTSVTPSENRNRPEQNSMRASTTIPTASPSFSPTQPSILSPKLTPKTTSSNYQKTVGTAQNTPSRSQNPVLYTPKKYNSPSISKQVPQRSSQEEQTQSNPAFAYRQMENIGNSCYINASMQALASCPSIVSRCTQLWRYIKPYSGSVCQLPSYLRVLHRCLWVMHNLCNERKEKFNKDLLKIFRTTFGDFEPYFGDERQQDAQEFLTFMFDAIDKSMKRQDILGKLSREDPPRCHAAAFLPALNPLLAMRHTVELCNTCQGCNEHSYNTDQREMSVVRLNSQKHDVISLHNLIKTDFEPKSMQMKCSKCNCNRAFTRGRFSFFPQCLIFHMERSIHKENFKVYKDDRRVDIPMQLDLSEFSSFVKNIGFESKKGRRLFSDMSLPNSPTKSVHNGHETAPRILGGGQEKTTSSEDIMFDSEVINRSLYFKPLSSVRTLTDILSNLEIECNKDRLTAHFKRLKTIETKTMEKNDPPGNTIDIETDGNCFFRAVSWCLTGEEKYHREIRKATVEYLEKNETVLEKYCTDKNYEDHVEEMKVDGAWATNCEIVAVSKMLNVNVYTYLSDGWLCQSPSQEGAAEDGSIYLNNTSEHYEPVTSIESNQVKSTVRRTKKRSASESGDEGSWKGKSDESKSESSEQTTRSRSHLKRRCTGSRQGSQNTRTTHPVTYQLVAVICHRGSCATKGHYTALSKDLYKNEWIMCDDAKIVSIDETAVLDKAGAESYLLFYDRQ